MIVVRLGFKWYALCFQYFLSRLHYYNSVFSYKLYLHLCHAICYIQILNSTFSFPYSLIVGLCVNIPLSPKCRWCLPFSNQLQVPLNFQITAFSHAIPPSLISCRTISVRLQAFIFTIIVNVASSDVIIDE